MILTLFFKFYLRERKNNIITHPTLAFIYFSLLGSRKDMRKLTLTEITQSKIQFKIFEGGNRQR